MSTAIEHEKRTHARPETAHQFVSPEVNIFESSNSYTIEAEMPGVSKDGLEITVEGTELTIVGHRKPADETADALYRESKSADYQRVFELDPAIDVAKIEAKIEQGVLTLHLPKSEKAKPHKIAITE